VVSIDRAPWEGLAPPGPYPYEETHDLRTGPDLHPALLGLLPYVGVWRGRGRGGYSTIDDFTYAQEVRFSHDGRPFLAYESRSWLLDADDQPVRPAAREVGWWRPVGWTGPPAGGAERSPRSSGPNDVTQSDDVEILLAHPTGFLELYVGKIDGLKVEVVTDAVVRTVTAKEVRAGHRLYGIVEGALMYAYDMAAVGEPLQPHLAARLERVGG
jgi:hypothetical protein